MVNKLYINIILLSLVSLIIIVLQQGEINRDGILYLTQAQYFIEGNLDRAMAEFDWPYFSIMIARLHQLSGISLQYIAHLINVALFIVASFFFIKNVSLVSQNKTPVYFATLILLTSVPLMDDYLGMVLRDHGHWAGFMVGVYCYLRWIKNPQWSWALLWQAGFMFGTIFRPECLVYNFLLPLTHQIFVVKTNRLKEFIQSISIPLVGLLFLPLIFFMFNFSVDTDYLNRLNVLLDRPMHFFHSMQQPLAIDTQNYYLAKLIANYVTSFKYLFLSYVAAYKWVAGLGLLNLAFFGYALKRRQITSPYLRVLCVFFVISSVITIINLYATFVISGRYWVMNFWIVYIVSAIGLSRLFSDVFISKHPHKKSLQYSLIAILFIYFLSILIDKPEKHFEQAAGEWIKARQLDLNNVFFNSQRGAFYAGQLTIENVDLNRATTIIQYQYLTIHYNQFDEIKPIKNYQPIQYFPSQDNPKVIIYKRMKYE